jgi:hypothetical protein
MTPSEGDGCDDRVVDDEARELVRAPLRGDVRRLDRGQGHHDRVDRVGEDRRQEGAMPPCRDCQRFDHQQERDARDEVAVEPSEAQRTHGETEGHAHERHELQRRCQRVDARSLANQKPADERRQGASNAPSEHPRDGCRGGDEEGDVDVEQSEEEPADEHEAEHLRQGTPALLGVGCLSTLAPRAQRTGGRVATCWSPGTPGLGRRIGQMLSVLESSANGYPSSSVPSVSLASPRRPSARAFL